MAENRSRSDGFMLRLPDGMRDALKASARLNERSMTAEIVARIAGTQANLRDQFAMAALTGALANQATASEAREVERRGDRSGAEFRQIIAEAWFDMADAMIAAREKGGGE